MNVSVVLYNTPEDELLQLLETLLGCKQVRKVYLIDNSPLPLSTMPWDGRWTAKQKNEWRPLVRLEYRHNERNIGYGAAHNIAIRESIYDEVQYHLVVNADIRIPDGALEELLAVMETNPEIGQLMPRVVNSAGELQYLCKNLPTPLDLLRRLLFPTTCAVADAEALKNPIKRYIARKNARFENRDKDYSRPMNVPYLSGCFMLLRVNALQEVGLFDERFFMYPEDIDLTRRIHEKYLTLYYPSQTIVHAHKKASFHSIKMLWVHIMNLCRYFNKWGWSSKK